MLNCLDWSKEDPVWKPETKHLQGGGFCIMEKSSFDSFEFFQMKFGQKKIKNNNNNKWRVYLPFVQLHTYTVG